MATKAESKLLIEAVNNNTIRGKKNEEDIQLIKNSIERIEKSIGSNINPSLPTTSYANAASYNCLPVQSGHNSIVASQDPARRNAFLQARRSLRLWPTVGTTEAEMMDATIDFCCKALGARRSSLG